MENKLQVIDFYAEWCASCKMLMPIINQLENIYSDNDLLSIEKCDVENDLELAIKYNIKSLPVILFVKDNVVLHRINGATSKKNITDKINEFLIS